MDTAAETENKVLIEEMIKAQSAPEPGAEGDKVVHKGDEEQPAPMTISSMKSAGYSYVYNIETGDRSLVNNNMLAAQLKKKKDGKRVFTTTEPTNIVKRPGLKCYLHPDDPNREHYNEMGLTTCKKSNLINEFQKTRHMQRKHKDEWAAIEAEKKEKENRVAQEMLGRLVGRK